MDIRRADWSLFRSFLAVVDSGTLLGAAKLLGSHQPTLSRHIAELESQLGVTLFERTGRGLIPTAAGLAAVDGARQMAAALQSIEAGILGTSAKATGTVRIAASEIVACYILPKCLADLADAHPGVQIEIVASNDHSNLLRREADVAIRMVRPTQSTLVARKIGDLALGAYASKGYAQRHGVAADPAALAKDRLVGLDADVSLIQGFADAGLTLTRDDFAFRTDNQIVYAELVRSGAGIGIMPRAVARQMPDLLPVLTEQLSASIQVWLAVHREIRESPLIRLVYDFIGDRISSVCRNDSL